MRVLDVSLQAELEIEEILVHSAAKFGLAAAFRYRILIEQAYSDLLESPTRVGVSAHDDIPKSLRLYPIRHSRDHVARDDRVGTASHVIVFRFDPHRVEILRLLHASMEFPGRLR